MRQSRIGRILTKGKFNEKKRRRMNKSAVFWFEFFSKRFGPGPSSVTKYVGNASMFAYAVKEKKSFVALAFCTRPRGYGSRSLSRVDDWC